ncbi:hypothetical protein Tco_0732105, partial [Tanacetum coccineum]
MACNFDKEAYLSMEKPVIIAVNSCKVTKYRVIQLFGTPATHYYFNPEIPGIEELQNQYRAQLDLNPPLEISKEKCGELEHEKNRNRFTLSTLLQQNLESYRNFKASVSDGSATTLFTFLTPNADVLIGKDCTQLVKMYNRPGPRDFPTETLNLKGQKHLFQFHYNLSCKKGRVDFFFDDILDKPLQISKGPSAQKESEQTAGLLSKEPGSNGITQMLATPSQLVI